MSIIIDGSKGAEAVSDTATQTLSNKTLVSPVINSPTLNRPNFGTYGLISASADNLTAMYFV